MACIALGPLDCGYLDNRSLLRDWSRARACVEMQCLMLQQDKPEHR
jgi:GDP-D-mannose dehydratase